MPPVGPVFDPSETVLASSHREYFPRAIQIYGKPKFEGRTQTQDDFQAWELPTHETHRPSESMARKHLPFTATSAYHDVFVEHTLEPREVHERPQYQGSNACFDGTSSYAQDFAAKELPVREPFVPRSTIAKTARFDATSSYKDTYCEHNIEPRDACKPSYHTLRHVPFEGRTSYEEEFISHPIEPQQPVVPQQTIRHSAKFQGTSTSHEAYVQHPIDVHFAPKAVYELRHIPFEGSTTNHQDYQQWPLQPRVEHQQPSLRATPAFQGTTTHQETFRGWELSARRQTLGVATVGDRLHTLIPDTLPLPVTAKQVFTTVRDDQSEMCLMIYQGREPVASRNSLLGQFQLQRIPPAPVGTPKLEVTFSLSRDSVLSVTARDLDSGRHHTWRQDNGAMIAVGVDAAQLRGGVLPRDRQAMASSA